jgi:hypothetical protein
MQVVKSTDIKMAHPKIMIILCLATAISRDIKQHVVSSLFTTSGSIKAVGKLVRLVFI